MDNITLALAFLPGRPSLQARQDHPYTLTKKRCATLEKNRARPAVHHHA
jgi:hypothetical protein